MYSILPITVAILFLSYGVYVLKAKGLNRVTIAFSILCLSTFFWQFSWAVLFQTIDEQFATGVITIGWMLILFLPTSLYHFLIEITGKYTDLKFVYTSYATAGLLVVMLITTDWLIEGHYRYFFGFYPTAGVLHPLHILQTCIVVTRGLYITYKKQCVVQAEEQKKLRFCIVSVLIYFFAAVDYICNYGIELYPFGAVFTAVALGIMAFATIRFEVMDYSKAVASAIAHEMKTPLATLRNQSQILSSCLPDLISGYQQAYKDDPRRQSLPDAMLDGLKDISSAMEIEAKSINQGINMLLAISSYEYLNKRDFQNFSAKRCIVDSIHRMPEKSDLEEIICFDGVDDFSVFASYEFMTFVITNVIKNSCDALSEAESANISIRLISIDKYNCVEITDSGEGVAPEILPHIFDKFFTTKRRGMNSGMGLSFCKKVMKLFGGDITCRSTLGEYTTFVLLFPIVPNS